MDRTQQKQTFNSNTKILTENKHEELKPTLVTFSDIRPENGAGLFLTAPEPTRHGSGVYTVGIHCALNRTSFPESGCQ